MPVSKAFAPLPSVAIVDILLNLTSIKFIWDQEVF